MGVEFQLPTNILQALGNNLKNLRDEVINFVAGLLHPGFLGNGAASWISGNANGNGGSIESPIVNILTPLFVHIPIRLLMLFSSLPFCLTAKILSSGLPLIGGWLPRGKIEWEPSFFQKGGVPCFLPK